MKGSTARRMLALNQAFYQAFAGPFAASRQRLQPGIPRALESLDLSGPLLDVGCGQGRVGAHLRSQGFDSLYLGLDGCGPLLEKGGGGQGALHFLEADLARPGWEKSVRRICPRFASAVCFALLHHLPGPGRRRRLLQGIASLLAPGAGLALSVWQPLRSARLRARLLPWESAGIDPGELEAGDLLVPWGTQDAPGTRYVHHFEEGELLRLLERSGFEPLELFRSDGKGGSLGLYALARRGQAAPRGDSRGPHPTFTRCG